MDKNIHGNQFAKYFDLDELTVNLSAKCQVHGNATQFVLSWTRPNLVTIKYFNQGPNITANKAPKPLAAIESVSVIGFSEYMRNVRTIRMEFSCDLRSLPHDIPIFWDSLP